MVADGSHEDLLNGLYADYAGYVSTAQLWVTNHSDELATNSFPDRGLSARIRRIPGVAQTRSYQGGFLDWNGRRVWMIARSPLASAMLPAGQIVEGRIDATLARLHSGGWITVSKQLAEAAGVRPGQRITLPTPSGTVTYRLAATTTNLGWASGAIVMNSADYRHAWGSADPSAIEVSIEHGASLHGVQRAIQATLAGDGLRVQTRAERAAQADGIAREGLSRLSQISLLLTIAAALSMAAAMSASIWQRRTSLASLRIQSFGVWQLRRLLLYESALILGIGCAIGALAGIYGHLLSDHFLRLTTGFPAPFSLGAGGLLETMLVVICAALVVLIGPGYAASQAQPTLALQE